MGGPHLAIHSLAYISRRGLICGNFEGIYCVPDIGTQVSTDPRNAKIYSIDKCSTGEKLDTVSLQHNVGAAVNGENEGLLLASYRRHMTEPFFKCFQIPKPVLSAEYVFDDDEQERLYSNNNITHTAGQQAVHWTPLFNLNNLGGQLKQTSIYQPCLIPSLSSSSSLLGQETKKRQRSSNQQSINEVTLCMVNEQSRSVLMWDYCAADTQIRFRQEIPTNSQTPLMALYSIAPSDYQPSLLGVLSENQLLLYGHK